MDIGEKIRIVALLDCYGELLTQTQQDFMSSYFEMDMSLAEIAENAGISRQAVRDALMRAEKSLETFEEKIGFLKFKSDVVQMLKDGATANDIEKFCE